MQHKTVIKLVPATMLASVVVVALARATTIHTKEDATFYHPMPPEAVKRINAQNKRAQDAETQARQFLKARHFQDAKQACARALALWPKFSGRSLGAPSTYQLLGDINREQGRYQDAIDAYLKTRDPHVMYMSSEDKQIELNTALCYLKMGDLGNARKFYDEDTFFKGGVGSSPAAKAQYLAQLPGTQTAKAMEASLYYARGCDRSGFSHEDALVDFKKALAIVPRNALAASRIAATLDDLDSWSKSDEMHGTPYWARAAVFGKGKVAREAQHELESRLTPDKVEQALDEARKVKE